MPTATVVCRLWAFRNETYSMYSCKNNLTYCISSKWPRKQIVVKANWEIVPIILEFWAICRKRRRKNTVSRDRFNYRRQLYDQPLSWHVYALARWIGRTIARSLNAISVIRRAVIAWVSSACLIPPPVWLDHQIRYVSTRLLSSLLVMTCYRE